MEVIFLEPILKDYIWGGNRLKTKLNKNSQYENVAESWEISANANGQSIIKNGKFKNRTLGELYKNFEVKQEIFGEKSMQNSEFPVLAKFIDADKNLSIQVHPNDEFARKYENSQGKSEVWYIIDCKENAQIICGMKDTTNNLENILNGGNIKDYLNFVNVKKGDYVYIEAGTVHAILNGILLCEIQQNSDITYRVYDWDRVGKDGKPRELHKEKALKVIDKNKKEIVKHTNNEDICQEITHNDKFSTDLINVKGIYNDNTDIQTFYAYNIVEGSGTLETDNKVYDLNLGDSFIVPATLGNYKIVGNLKLLKTFI